MHFVQSEVMRFSNNIRIQQTRFVLKYRHLSYCITLKYLRTGRDNGLIENCKRRDGCRGNGLQPPFSIMITFIAVKCETFKYQVFSVAEILYAIQRVQFYRKSVIPKKTFCRCPLFKVVREIPDKYKKCMIKIVKIIWILNN